MPEIENNETNVVTENAGMGTNGDFGDNAGGDSTSVNSSSSGIKPITIENNVSAGNTKYMSVANRVQIFIGSKKEERGYIQLQNFKIKITNKMMEHSIMEAEMKIDKFDKFTREKIDELLIPENKDFMFNTKYFIGVDLGNEKNEVEKTYFYGLITKVEGTIWDTITITAVSITKLMDRVPMFIDYKTDFTIKDFLDSFKEKIRNYYGNEANVSTELRGYLNFKWNIIENNEPFLNYKKKRFVLQYNETFWQFLIRFLYYELKIPVYIQGRNLVIGFEAQKESSNKKEEPIRLNKNMPISEYLELGTYYKGYCISESEIVINSLTKTQYFYESKTISEIKTISEKIKVEFPNSLEGKVKDAVNIVVSDEKIQEEYLQNQEKLKEIENAETNLKNDIINLQDSIENETETEEKVMKKREELLKLEKSKEEYSNRRNGELDENENKFISEKQQELKKKQKEVAMLEADKKFHQERTEKIIEKGERIGVYVDFSQMLIDEGKEALNYREEVEGKENGTVIMKNNQTEINSYYPFPILINTGYLSGTSTVVIPSEKENVVVEFRNIRDGYVIGALANDTRKDIEKRKVVLQVAKVEMNAPQVNVEATKVEMNANDIDYNLKGE